MPYLALILFLPWFVILGVLYWLYPRVPATRARRVFDALALAIATGASFAGMRWGYLHAATGTAALWKQVLATLVAYGLFLGVLTIALIARARLLRR